MVAYSVIQVYLVTNSVTFDLIILLRYLVANLVILVDLIEGHALDWLTSLQVDLVAIDIVKSHGN